MNREIKYEIPIYFSNLENDPIFRIKDMDVEMELFGADDNGREKRIIIKFVSVLCTKYTAARFTPQLYDSYDRVVEVVDSEWLKELKTINEGDFRYWNPKHYVIFLDEIGMYQFVAQKYEVLDSE